MLEFIPGEKIGHFISHVKRKNGEWETYDDKATKVTKLALGRNFVCHLIFYLKDAN